MRSKNKINKDNLATPGLPITEEEFRQRIQQAEKGPFFPIEELEAHIRKWKEKYGK